MFTQTLILNQHYRPHEIVDWKDAVTRMFGGKIEVLVQYDEVLAHIDRQTLQTFPELKRSLRQVIGTDAEGLDIKVPAVAVLRRRLASVKSGVKFSKINVCLRDDFTCFGSGTRILMADGSFKHIEDVRRGDRVIDAYGKPETVVATGSRIVDNAFYLKRRGSYEQTVVTGDHPFLTAGGEFVPITDRPEYLVLPRKVVYERAPATSTCISKFLDGAWMKYREGRVYWSKRSHEAGFPAYLTASPDLAYVLGLYCAEGSSDMTARWSFCMDEQHTLAPRVIQYVEGLGIPVSCDALPERDTFIVRASSKTLGMVLRGACGTYSDGKRVPWELVGPYHEDFLRGLFRGDGYVRDDKIVLSLTSYDLIFGAESMLWGMGIFPSVQHGHLEGKKPTWSLVLQGENFVRFMANLGKEVPMRDPIYGDSKNVFRKFQELEPAALSVMVYNLEVSGSHTYIANGMAVHNCQYCGATLPMSQLNYDHVLPRSKGGKTVWDNIVMACYPCNDRKGNKTLEESGMTPLNVPVKPAILPMNEPLIDVQKAPDEWQPFIKIA